MRPALCLLCLLIGPLAGCAPIGAPQAPSLDATVILRDAAMAIGGADRVLAARTLRLEGTAKAYNLGQDLSPESTGQTFVGDYVRRVDLANSRAVLEHTRTPTFLYFAGQQPQKQVQGVDGTVAFNVGANGVATRAPGAAGIDRQAEFYHHPLTALRAALDPAARLTNARAVGAEWAIDVTMPAGVALTLTVDRATKRPARVTTRAHNPYFGDVTIATSFANYQEVGGLLLPTLLTTKTDRWTTMQVQVGKNAVNVDVGSTTAPAAAAPAPAPGPQNVTVDPRGQGIWVLGGGAEGSVLVEFSDHLLLLETPVDEARTLAVIAKARSIVPGKPLTHAVNLHHHVDHSGGVRAAVSEGLTIIAHRNSDAFLRELVSRPRTIAPDALARAPKSLKLELVNDSRVLNDATADVRLFHIAGSTHSTTGLMAYIPSLKLLIEGDDYFVNPAGIYPFAPALLSEITRRGLAVEQIYTIHAPIVPFTDLVQAASVGSRGGAR